MPEQIINAEQIDNIEHVGEDTNRRVKKVESKASIAPPMPATTTFQEDLTHAGQRKVNLIWEYTQALIAIVVVGSTMAVGVRIGFSGGNEDHLPTILGTGFGLVVGFYFSRTNHSAIGGVGAKPQDEYKGR